MSTRWDIARYHKPLSVCIFGGGTLALFIASVSSLVAGRTGLGLALGVVFVLLAVPLAFYFLDLFVWQPRRQSSAESVRMKDFLTADEHRRDRARQDRVSLR